MSLMRSVTGVLLVLIGLAAGWWLRDSAPEVSHIQRDSPGSSTSAQTATPPHRRSNNVIAKAQVDSLPAIEPTPAVHVARFEQLLKQGEYELAIAHYETALEIDGGFESLLKPRLEKYLRAHLQDCVGDAFLDLADAWLAAYYEDISVLLLLAENQGVCGSAEEAARTLLLADTYALAPGQKVSVAAAVERLIQATDKSLSREQRWIELLNFYEFLQIIDLGSNHSRLRLASLYQMMGDSQRSRDLLRELRENDDGLNSDWTAAVDRQWAKTAQQVVADVPATLAIPLTRRGDHFLLAASINEVIQVILMIDTGASVTTLSKDAFIQIDSSGLAYRGTRLFNTANGVTRGDVYMTASVSLGNARTSAVEIAVLDYDSFPGIDGVLGMNVLRNFRFEIDQDKEILYLRPRP